MPTTEMRKQLSKLRQFQPSEEAKKLVLIGLFVVTAFFASLNTLGITPMEFVHALPGAFRHVGNLLLGKEQLGDQSSYFDREIGNTADYGYRYQMGQCVDVVPAPMPTP